MIDKVEQLVNGALIFDARRERKIRLERRINPMGADVPPYWAVVNEETGKTSLIRENRLTGKRWSIVGGIASGR